MKKDLAGNVVLVTGGGGTKGLKLAERLTSDGAEVILSDIDLAGARSNASALGTRVRAVGLDVTDEKAWTAAVGQIERDHGRLDILVNSARIHTRNSDLAATSLESWRSQLSVNLDGAFLGIKHCLPLLRKSGAGSIINVVSLSAVAPFAPTPAYSASHAALLNLTKTAAVNCARAGERIRVNAVICGMSSNSPVGEVMEVARRLVPLGRPAVAEEIADAIAWLASNEARYITGTSITLDGGYSAEGMPGA